MTRKDYVKSGQPPKRRRNNKKSPAKNKPWKAIFCAIIAVSCLAGGLYILNGDPEPVPTVQQTASPSQAKTKPEAELPPPPKEEWDFITTLPEKEVQVKAKELTVSTVPYIMQCGAYKTLEKAEERKMDIAFQGISSEIKKSSDSSWYRVVLGPYERKRDAEKDKHKLQRVKIEPCAIWKDQ